MANLGGRVIVIVGGLGLLAGAFLLLKPDPNPTSLPIATAESANVPRGAAQADIRSDSAGPRSIQASFDSSPRDPVEIGRAHV